MATVNLLKLRTTFLFLFSIYNVGYLGWDSKIACQKANREDLIRLLLQKQSDLGLSCLS